MSFYPKYIITDKILNNLTNIAANREIIEQSYLVPQWEAKLRKQAMLHSTHSSTAIEGNNLSLKQVEQLRAGQEVLSTTKDKNEVLNYLNVLEKIPSFGSHKDLKAKDLLHIHKLITKSTLDDKAFSGVFRDRQVFVGKKVFKGTSFKEEVEYMPPKTNLVPTLVESFFKWLNKVDSKELNPILIAGITHYEIVRIHPFIDGNGRTARVLATLVLYSSGFDHRRIFALDDFYDRDRVSYYLALKSVQKKKGDLTDWLEYFTTGVSFSVNEIKEIIEKAGIKNRNTNTKQIVLTSKQFTIVEHINKYGKVTNKDLQELFKISAQAVHKELIKLLNQKIIRSAGKGRSIYYELDI